DQAIALRPRLAPAYDNRAMIHITKGNYRAAIEDFDAALKLDPNYAPSLQSRGLAHERLGQLAEAERDYRQALGVQPGDPSLKAALKRVRHRRAELAEDDA
ncbi:MAG: tetratricopeptide repeat protein, partial [Geminicoccaceae bacterium]